MMNHSPTPTTGVIPHERLSIDRRVQLLGRRGCTIWLTGLPASGKSTISLLIEEKLLTEKRPALILDGDTLRHGLNAGLGFDAGGRAEAVRRAGESALLIAESGAVAIVSMVSPYCADRDAVRARHAKIGIAFIEVFVDAPLAVAESRDPKGLYKKARAGEIPTFTGVTDPYEAPIRPEVHVRTHESSAHECAIKIFAAMTA
jgi:bifunctional enzyme CysN/CysC